MGSEKVSIQALSPRSNNAVENKLGLAYMIERRPRGQWAVKKRKLDLPKYYGRRE